MRITIKVDEAKLRSLSRSLLRAAEMIESDTTGELEDSAARLESEARMNALRILPRRGGLAAEVAGSEFTRRRQRAGMTTNVVVVASSDYDLGGINEGKVIHPVYGRPPWVEQAVAPGWFTDPLDEIERDLVDNMDSLMRRAISIIR